MQIKSPPDQTDPIFKSELTLNKQTHTHTNDGQNPNVGNQDHVQN